MESYIANKEIPKLENLPEPTVTPGSEGGVNGTLIIEDLIPIQVVQNVDLVKGKRTLVRTVLEFTNTSNQTYTATIDNLYLNGTKQNFSNHTNLISLTPGPDNFLDVFF